VWQGDVPKGTGHIKVGSGAFEGPYDFRSRSADGSTTNPEELLGAAHAACFSMALSGVLMGAGLTAERIHTTAKVHFEKVGAGFGIPRIDLETEATVPGLDEAAFQQHADNAKKNCPVSKALAGVEIHLAAKLV
jgi:osmotically inducible protein OsmC